MKASTQYILVGVLALIAFFKANNGVSIGSPIELLAKFFPYAIVTYMSVSIYQKTNLLFGVIIFVFGITPLVLISINGVKAYNEAIVNNAWTAAGLTVGFTVIQSIAVLIILFLIYVLMDFPERFQRKPKSCLPNETIENL